MLTGRSAGRARRSRAWFARRSAWSASDGSALVGFTRTVSDGHWITYLADCYVLPSHRGSGLGYELVRETVEAGPYKDHGWLLHTAYASGLYKKFGFEMRSEYLMERPATT